MGLDDLVSKAKDALEGREEQVKSVIDKAADVVKSRTDDAGDRKVDDVAAKAKELLDQQKAQRDKP